MRPRRNLRRDIARALLTYRHHRRSGHWRLTAALAIAQRGFRVAVFDQAECLEEAGAGIQLSPNASRILIALGWASSSSPPSSCPKSSES